MTQNGVTNARGNENWSDFNSPERNVDGAVTMAMQLRGTQVVSTPEPASVVLTATGLAGLLGYARRRRASPA